MRRTRNRNMAVKGGNEKNTATKNVAVLLRLEIMPGRQQLVGFFRYLKLHARRWNVALSTHPEELETPLDGHFDGVICAEDRNAMRAKGCITDSTALVAIDVAPGTFSWRSSNTTLLNVDDAAIGRMVADHLLSLGRARSAGFVNAPSSPAWSLRRKAAFKKAVHSAGLDCSTYDMVGMQSADLASWLDALPKPAILMVANDRCAVQVLEACSMAKIRVPEQISIASVDDDRFYCDYVTPSLSSVDPGYEREGFLAAQELDAIMTARRPRRTRTVEMPPAQMVVRESTSFMQPAAHLVDQALAFINENACRGIGVDDVVKALGVSRRLLYLRFAQFQGKGVGECIRRRQLERMKELLLDTDMPPGKISSMCGFADSRYAKRIFRMAFGVSMCDYRQCAAVSDYRRP